MPLALASLAASMSMKLVSDSWSSSAMRTIRSLKSSLTRIWSTARPPFASFRHRSHRRSLTTLFTREIAESASASNHSPRIRLSRSRRWHDPSALRTTSGVSSILNNTFNGIGLPVCSLRNRDKTSAATPILTGVPGRSLPITYRNRSVRSLVDVRGDLDRLTIGEGEPSALEEDPDRNPRAVIGVLTGFKPRDRVAADTSCLRKLVPAHLKRASRGAALCWRHVHVVLSALFGLKRQPLWVRMHHIEHDNRSGHLM